MGARTAQALRVLGSKGFAQAALLVAIGLIWLWLGSGPFHVGPSEWDDHYYCHLAVEPARSWPALNRYAHVWALRTSYLVFGASGLALYPLLMTLAASAGAYVVARAAAGPVAGLLTAAILPAYPATLRYLDVPFADGSMATGSMLAVACACAARHKAVERSRQRWLWLLGSGCACFFAVKSKEPGLAVIPAVLMLVVPSPIPSLKALVRPLSLWALGVTGAWLLLIVADAVFLGDFAYSLRLDTYLRRIPPLPNGTAFALKSAAAGTKFGDDFVSLLMTGPFWGWTLAGVAGGVLGFRRSPAVRALVIWTLSALLFSALIATRFTGIHALPRYAVVPGMPLVALGVYYAVTSWGKREAPSVRTTWLRWLLVLVSAGGAWAFASSSTAAARAAYFVGPVVLLFLGLVSHVSRDGLARRSALILLAGLIIGRSVIDGVARHGERRQRMAPWDTLARHLVSARSSSGQIPRLSLYRLPKPYSTVRVERRLAARMPTLAPALQVRTVKRADALPDGDVVITRAEHTRDLSEAGWQVLTESVLEPGEKPDAERFVALVKASGDAARHSKGR